MVVEPVVDVMGDLPNGSGRKGLLSRFRRRGQRVSPLGECVLVEGSAALLSSTCQRQLAFRMSFPSPPSVPFCLHGRWVTELPANRAESPRPAGTYWVLQPGRKVVLTLRSLDQFPPLAHNPLTLGMTPLLEHLKSPRSGSFIWP